MSKVCSIKGCGRTDIQGYGWCGLHYNRWRRTGNPTRTNKYVRLGTGVKGSPEHNSWAGMKQRCYYKSHRQYRDYGGRGIKVCDRWLGPEGFIHFLEDMGEKPAPKNKYSLDRIDNDGDYYPENCRWADRYTQSGNRSWGKKDSKVVGVWKFNEKYWVGGITINGKTVTKYAKTEKEAIQKRKELEEQYLSKRNTHH